LKRVTRTSCIILALLLIMAVVAGCAPKAATPTPVAEPVSLSVAAAASLTDALDEVNSLYVKDKTNVTITPNYAGSGALQTQIEQGAPTDVFISAATKQIDALKEKQLLLDDTIKNVLANKLVLVVPTDSTAGIASFEDLTTDKAKRVAIGDPKSVPCGQYAVLAFEQLGIKDKVEPKQAVGADVRAILAYVENGSVDAGIVYLTDTKVSTKVKVVAEAPAEINAKIIYPAAVIKASKVPDAAREYVNFLSSAEAKAVFEKHGFTVL
jgi:molybdate transport system substrate-binding protein